MNPFIICPSPKRWKRFKITFKYTPLDQVMTHFLFAPDEEQARDSFDETFKVVGLPDWFADIKVEEN